MEIKKCGDGKLIVLLLKRVPDCLLLWVDVAVCLSFISTDYVDQQTDKV